MRVALVILARSYSPRRRPPRTARRCSAATAQMCHGSLGQGRAGQPDGGCQGRDQSATSAGARRCTASARWRRTSTPNRLHAAEGERAAAAPLAAGARAEPRSTRWSATSRRSARGRRSRSRIPSGATSRRGCRSSARTARAATRSSAEGGYVTGAVPPALGDATPTQVAEAVRIGPYVMPRVLEEGDHRRAAELDRPLRPLREAPGQPRRLGAGQHRADPRRARLVVPRRARC